MNLISYTKKIALLLTSLLISYTAAAFAPDEISSSSPEVSNNFAYLQLALNTSVSEFTRDYAKKKVDASACRAIQCKGENSKCCSNNSISWCVKTGAECRIPE